VAEGIPTTKALYNIAKREDIYLPIADEVHKMLEGKEPFACVQDLLNG